MCVHRRLKSVCTDLNLPCPPAVLWILGYPQCPAKILNRLCTCNPEGNAVPLLNYSVIYKLTLTANRVSADSWNNQPVFFPNSFSLVLKTDSHKTLSALPQYKLRYKKGGNRSTYPEHGLCCLFARLLATQKNCYGGVFGDNYMG